MCMPVRSCYIYSDEPTSEGSSDGARARGLALGRGMCAENILHVTVSGGAEFYSTRQVRVVDVGDAISRLQRQWYRVCCDTSIDRLRGFLLCYLLARAPEVWPRARALAVVAAARAQHRHLTLCGGQTRAQALRCVFAPRQCRVQLGGGVPLHHKQLAHDIEPLGRRRLRLR